MARPKKYTDPGYAEKEYKSAQSLQERIDMYFASCESMGVFPDEAGMRVYLGISKDTIERYLKNENGKYSGFAAPIKNARDRRESILVREIYNSDSKEATGKIFLAKQISCGGLVDRPRDEAQTGEVTIKVQIDGIKPANGTK